MNAHGFADSGFFRLYTIGPLYARPHNNQFNFSDDPDTLDSAPYMFWLSNKFNQAEFAESEIAVLSSHPKLVNFFDLIWAREQKQSSVKTLPLNAVFKRIGVVTMRTSWDENATFVGFKGGVASANHGHLDHGSFVLDTQGERWIEDLGRDDYGLPGYFDTKTGQRWTHYRMSTAGHNTISIDKQNQRWDVSSPLERYALNGNQPFAIVNLSKALGSKVRSARRGIKLFNQKYVGHSRGS